MVHSKGIILLILIAIKHSHAQGGGRSSFHDKRINRTECAFRSLNAASMR